MSLRRWVVSGAAYALGVSLCAATLPLVTDFELAEGYAPGPTPSGDRWTFSSTLTATVATGGYAGDQALALAGAGWLDFPTDESVPNFSTAVTWVDFYLKPVFAGVGLLPANLGESLAAVTGFVKVDSTGEVYVLNGDGQGGGQWTASGFTATLSDGRALDWLRVSYRVDYGNKRWDLFLNGDLILADLGFVRGNATSFVQLRLNASPDKASLLDSLYMGAENPLFTDTSGDGLPDSWLLAHGLDPATFQRYADPDHDGVDNLTEFRLGLSPNSPDTDNDGVYDRRELLWGANPKVADVRSLGTVPFADGFETDAPGPFATGTRGWLVQAGEQAAVEIATGAGNPEGALSLSLTGASTAVERHFADTTRASVVWLDFYMKGSSRIEPPAEIPADVAAVFYFTSEGKVMVLDGGGQGGGEWRTLELTVSAWNHVSLRMDYASQRWSIWFNGIRYGHNLGFAHAVPYFSGFALKHSDWTAAGLDGFRVLHTEPVNLDNDNDGLTNAVEITHGTNTDSADTDGDGIRDATEIALNLNPLQAESLVGQLVSDGDGNYQWQTHFAVNEGYVTGALDTQQGWKASGAAVTSAEQAHLTAGTDDALIEHFFNASRVDRVWISFRARLVPGQLPADTVPEAVSGLFGYRSSSRLAIFDPSQAKWKEFSVPSQAGDWNDYAMYFDYVQKRWLLTLNGRLIARDLPFLGTAPPHFTRFRMLQPGDAVESERFAALDDLVVSTAEPAYLDYDGDGLTNVREHALGTDQFKADTDGDGIPDDWEVAHSGNPLSIEDGLSDGDVDGLTAAVEYRLGTDPTVADGEVAGGAMMETWTGISGAPVVDLTTNAKFGSVADRKTFLFSLESESTGLNSYGNRVCGYLVPSENSNYTFWVAGDDAVEFWLSSTDRPFERRRVACSTSATAFRAFSGGTRQSLPVPLVAGQRYYFEVLHKENSGSDHFSIAWQTATGPRVVIPGANLARFLPRADDLDGDGLPDLWETANSLDPAVAHGPQGAYADNDSDGLTNLAEYQTQTNPGAADTDTDGLPDGWEIGRGLNPADPADATLNTDDDGLTALEEFQAGTDPFKDDTDGDGLPDGWEVGHGLNPLLASDATVDPDGDGFSNFAEYILGSDPAAANAAMPGVVLAETWSAINGANTTDLTNNSKFNGAASFLTPLATLEMASDGTERYGRRVRGFITAPVSGDYTFWVAGDDRVEWWLSSDDTPFRTRRLGFMGASTAFRQFESRGVSVSPPVSLQAGRRYYFEVLHKNDVAAGHFSVAWQIPGSARAVISAAYLSAFASRSDDADGDGLPDAWETAGGLKPATRNGTQGGYGDPDGDGLLNLHEHQAGTAALNVDTDTDGYSDFMEIHSGHAADDPEDAPSSLPAPWTVEAVGTVAGTPRIVAAGSSDAFLVQARGTGIRNRVVEDGFLFASQPVSGDFEFTARVRLLEGLRSGSGALVLRMGSDAGAPMFSVEIAGSNRYIMEYRSAAGGMSAIMAEHTIPDNNDTHYLRLGRRGPSIRAEHSLDGLQWTSLGALTLPDAEIARLGFTAWNNSTSPAARLFDAISLRIDTDGDGLFDDEEAAMGTSSVLVDTDGDGVSDFDERKLGTNPRVADANVVTVATYTGSSGIPSLGSWRTVGDASVSTTVRANLEFDITLPSAGVYRLEFEALSPANRTPCAVFPVEVWIDGQFIDRVDLLLPAGAAGLARVITPWLAGGTHRVRFVYDNTLSYRPIQVNALRVQEIGGPDADHNQRADWIDTLLAADNSLAAGSGDSFVSPAFVEGVGRFFNFLALEVDGSPAVATSAPGHGWYTDIPLVPGAPVHLCASFENGAFEAARDIEWIPFNLLSDPATIPNGRLRIRLDDTLLLTATPQKAKVDNTEQEPHVTTTIVIGGAGRPGETFTLDRPSTAPQAYTFAAPGLYTVTGTYVSTQGQGATLTGTIEVEVVAAAFSGDPVAGLDNPVVWDNPLIPADVALEHDQGVELADLPAASGSSFRLLTRNLGVSRVVARLAPGGPVLDRALVTGLRAVSDNQTAIDTLQVYPDGSRLIGTPIMLSEITPDTRVEVEIFVNGVTFEDGTTLKVFTAADFDEFGRVYVKFVYPAGLGSSFCHRVHVYRGDTYLGTF